MEVRIEYTQYDSQGRPIEAVVQETGKQRRFIRGTPEEVAVQVKALRAQVYETGAGK